MISRRRHCCDVYIYFFVALTSTVDISTQQLTPRQSRFTNSTTGKRKTMYFRVNCPFKNVTKRSSVKHVLNVVLQSVLFFSNMVSCPSIPFTESCCIVGKKKIILLQHKPDVFHCCCCLPESLRAPPPRTHLVPSPISPWCSGETHIINAHLG